MDLIFGPKVGFLDLYIPTFYQLTGHLSENVYVTDSESRVFPE